MGRSHRCALELFARGGRGPVLTKRMIEPVLSIDIASGSADAQYSHRVWRCQVKPVLCSRCATLGPHARQAMPGIDIADGATRVHPLDDADRRRVEVASPASPSASPCPLLIQGVLSLGLRAPWPRGSSSSERSRRAIAGPRAGQPPTEYPALTQRFGTGLRHAWDSRRGWFVIWVRKCAGARGTDGGHASARSGIQRFTIEQKYAIKSLETLYKALR